MSNPNNNSKLKVYTNVWILIKEDVLTHHGHNSRECDTTYPNSGLSRHAYLTSEHIHFN